MLLIVSASGSVFLASETVNTGGTELITGSTIYDTTVKGTPQPVRKLGFDIMGGSNVFPIGGWWGPYTPNHPSINGIEIPDYISDEFFGGIREAGVNFISVSPNTYDGNPSTNSVIGCFDYLGGTAFYVVNHSPTSKDKVTLEFDKKYGMDITQRGRKVGVAGKSVTLTLEGGEGVLVVLR